MRFTVEERHLTDSAGRPIPAPGEVAFHHVDAETIDAAVTAFVAQNTAEILGSVLKFPGFQAVATIRRPSGVYTVQFTPTSQQHYG